MEEKRLKAEQAAALERRRAILLPLILLFVTLLLALGALVFFGWNDPTLPRKLADLSLILMLALGFLGGALGLAFLVWAISAVASARRALPGAMDVAADKTEAAGALIVSLMDRIAAPLIKLKGGSLSAADFLRRIFPQKEDRQ